MPKPDFHIYILPLLSVLALTLMGCGPVSTTPESSSHGQTTVVFPSETIQFAMPTHYSQDVEPDNTIAITPKRGSGITIRLTSHSLPAAIATEFVEKQAADKGVEVMQIGNKSVFSEEGSRNEDGIDYSMTFWQIGFEDYVVVMSAEVEKKHADSQSVRDCLDDIQAIIESIRKAN